MIPLLFLRTAIAFGIVIALAPWQMRRPPSATVGAPDRRVSRAPATPLSPRAAPQDLGIPAADALRLGTGPVGLVWNAPFTFAPSRADALALAWTGIRHGFDPNHLAALAIKESQYRCLADTNGCFQLEEPAYVELQRQFPATFRRIAYGDAVRTPSLAPQTAAHHLRTSELLFRRWYDWDAFLARARDPDARLKLLTRAYNRGAWDRNIGMILTADRQRCIAERDLLACYDAHRIARDHTEAVVAIAHALRSAVPYDGVVTWPEVEALLRDGVHPLHADASGDVLVRETRARYDALARARGAFTFRRELPRLLAWLAGYLPPLEAPQQLQHYFAPA